ncbi:MAG: FAD/NAD(P)-binding protein [Sedimentisphaerales bacterium]|nr:FAD/NAD(P)-binding protein [Sedimentisphaerales bacterium]
MAQIVNESPTIKTFTVIPETPISFKTGQFVELALPGVGEVPFTPSSSPSEASRLEITIMNTGRVTSRLHQAKPGQLVGLMGPLGNGYPVEAFQGRHVYVIGGVGLAPIRSLLLTLFDRPERFRSIVCRFGARTPDDLIYKQHLFGAWQKMPGVDLKVTVDKANGSWKGNVGVVTTIMRPTDVDPTNAVAGVCGPPIMMKFVTVKLLDFGLRPADIYLSMEKNMSCGVGKCGHCMTGRYYVCTDGPVFTYEEIQKYPNVWA